MNSRHTVSFALGLISLGFAASVSAQQVCLPLPRLQTVMPMGGQTGATFEASNLGTVHFGEVIGQLMGAGVESYHVDYRSGRTTYYLPDGSTADFSFERPQHVGEHSFLDRRLVGVLAIRAVLRLPQ